MVLLYRFLVLLSNRGANKKLRERVLEPDFKMESHRCSTLVQPKRQTCNNFIIICINETKLKLLFIQEISNEQNINNGQ